MTADPDLAGEGSDWTEEVVTEEVPVPDNLDESEIEGSDDDVSLDEDY